MAKAKRSSQVKVAAKKKSTKRASTRSATGAKKTAKKVAKKTQKKTQKKPYANANKTQKTTASVDDFVSGIENAARQKDVKTLLGLMARVTGEKPFMYGSSIVGFGSVSVTYESGRQVDWFLTGLSPRKQNLTVYIMAGFRNYQTLLDRLGKHKTGVSCLYLNSLSDIDIEILEELITESTKLVRAKYASP